MIVAPYSPYSWLSRWADSCTEGYECPFESLWIAPVSEKGEILLLIDDADLDIVGLRQGGERSVRTSSSRLGEIARDHLRSRHGVTNPLDATWEQSGHAMAIAAVACLMD